MGGKLRWGRRERDSFISVNRMIFFNTWHWDMDIHVTGKKKRKKSES